jgi:HlyD family secretion protein
VVNGKAVKTAVKISHRNPERALVESGLNEGDRVIVYPSDQIEEGTKVEVMATQLRS